MGQERGVQIWHVGVQASPRVTGTDRQMVRPCDTGAGLKPRVAPAGSMCAWATRGPSQGPLAAMRVPQPAPSRQPVLYALPSRAHSSFASVSKPVDRALVCLVRATRS